LSTYLHRVSVVFASFLIQRSPRSGPTSADHVEEPRTRSDRITWKASIRVRPSLAGSVRGRTAAYDEGANRTVRCADLALHLCVSDTGCLCLLDRKKMHVDQRHHRQRDLRRHELPDRLPSELAEAGGVCRGLDGAESGMRTWCGRCAILNPFVGSSRRVFREILLGMSCGAFSRRRGSFREPGSYSSAFGFASIPTRTQQTSRWSTSPWAMPLPTSQRGRSQLGLDTEGGVC